MVALGLVERLPRAAEVDQHSPHPGRSGEVARLFPDRRPDEILIDRFNEEMQFQYESIRDFIIAHYKVTERDDTPFWQYCKNMSIPSTLADKIELFATRGEVKPRPSDLFSEVSWFAILYGQGIVPSAYHPVADTMSEDDSSTLTLARIRGAMKKRVDELPSHGHSSRVAVRRHRGRALLEAAALYAGVVNWAEPSAWQFWPVVRNRLLLARLCPPPRRTRRCVQFPKLLSDWKSAHGYSALGIVDFGPVDLDTRSASYGQITSTPKPGWRGTDVVGRLQSIAGVPTGFDTDVNGAALAEMRWGSGQASTISLTSPLVRASVSGSSSTASQRVAFSIANSATFVLRGLRVTSSQGRAPITEIASRALPPDHRLELVSAIG